MMEIIKTGVLWLLILTSIVLTWMLWSYQPEYQSLDEDSGETYVEIEDIGETRSLNEILQPREVLLHNQEQIDYIHPDGELYQDVLEAMEEVEIDYFVQRSSTNAPSPESTMSGVELVFDEAVPGEIMEEMITMEDDTLPVEKVDRIIAVENDSSIGSEVLIQFVDIYNEELYEADTDLSVGELDELSEEAGSDRTPVEARVFDERSDTEFQHVRYVPVEEMTLNQYTYETIDLSPQAFRQVLFSDPEFVEEYHQTDNEEAYTDGSRMMNILEDGMIMSFSQTDAADEAASGGDEHLIEEGREFINSHSGWTGDFYWDEFSEHDAEESVSYRMHVGNYPVMSSNTNQSEYYMMDLQRAGSDITEYTRPLYQFADNPFDTDADVEIEPIDEVEEYIEENETFTMDEVQDMKIGHYMNRNRSFSTFEPSWFVQVRDRWVQLGMNNGDGEDPEVETDGLE